MTRSKFNSVALQIQGEALSEVFLVDGEMRRIASGIGSLRTKVTPGLYKIRSRKGGEQLDRLIEVTGDQDYQHEDAPVIVTSSEAPLLGTATSHEYQALPARDLSLTTHVKHGSGSQLFIYVRDPDISNGQSWSLPPESVSILDLEGNPLCDLQVGQADPHAGFCGVNLEVNPGTFRLRVETGALGSHEIFITTVERWQTQVFVVMENFTRGDQTVRRPSLKDALVMMTKIGRGFDPHGEEQRLVSQAKTALTHNRRLISEEIMNRLVYGKFSDPLFGIYALGLLLLDKKNHEYDTKEILRNLHRLLGPEHPDLIAFRLAFEPESVKTQAPFNRPPLLFQSWQQLLRCSRDDNRLIPGGSLLSQLAQNFVLMRPWLIHQVPEGGWMDQQPGTVSLAAAKRTLASLIQAGAADLTATTFPSLSGLEVQILRNLDDHLQLNQLLEENHKPVPDELTQANRIFNRLNAPGYSIANAITNIANRLDTPRS